jgi:hypothetical protein
VFFFLLLYFFYIGNKCLKILHLFNLLGDQPIACNFFLLIIISGTFLITVLLGYGLVAVPRAIWRIRDFNITLRFYYYKLSETEESLTEC